MLSQKWLDIIQVLAYHMWYPTIWSHQYVGLTNTYQYPATTFIASKKSSCVELLKTQAIYEHKIWAAVGY